MKAYIFPGQGAQFVGMGLDLYENHPEAQELFEQASRDHDNSVDASTVNHSDDRGYYGGGRADTYESFTRDDYSLGSIGNAPPFGMKDFVAASNAADASQHDNQAYSQIVDDLAALRAELAQLQQQKDKMKRSPLETMTATSVVSPPRTRPVSTANSANTSFDSPHPDEEQLRADMSGRKAYGMKVLDDMWASFRKPKTEPTPPSSRDRTPPRDNNNNNSYSFGLEEEPRTNQPQPSDMSDVSSSMQSAEKLYKSFLRWQATNSGTGLYTDP